VSVNKVAHYLQQHLVGEVLTSPDVLRYFSTDESIFEIKPMLVVHPRNENDLRKTARFSWQLAERGRSIPITIKGKGTDQTGASLGSGIILSTPAHMNKIIELDPKSGVVTVEAGTIVGKLQQTLYTHGRFLPSVASSSEYSTIGGAVGNNDAGSSSYKYGPIREYVQGLRVVLANGELIRTGRLSKREFNRKLGLASFEGEIYRSLDKLLEESADAIAEMSALGERSNVGYAIGEVKAKDGSFDLTPLFVGSQGTLGLISEIILNTEAHSATTDLMVLMFTEREQAWQAIEKINALKDSPLSVDFIDKSLVSYVQSVNPNLLKSTIKSNTPVVTVFVEIERIATRTSKKIQKKIHKIINELRAEIEEPSQEEKPAWMALKDSASLFIGHSDTSLRAVPVVDDADIPVARFAEFLDRVDLLMEKSGQKKYAIWGQAGSGVVHTAPSFDISQVGDRQKIFKLMDEYYSVVVEMGGSVAGEFGEGRLRGAQLTRLLKPEVIEVMNKVKAIFDPFNTLNPGVKVNVDAEGLKSLVRQSYTLDHQYSHLPRS
jgi:FAD/FMN-containing dehydrogenase